MAKDSIFTKMRKKLDKEFAEEITAKEQAEKEAARAEKEAAKAARIEAAKAKYKEERTITVRKFFEIAGLDLPDHIADIADVEISCFTADPKRLDEKAIFTYWGGPQTSKYDYDAFAKAAEMNCLLILTDTPCDYHHHVLFPETENYEESPVRNAYVAVSEYIRNIHKAKIITVTGSVGKTSTKEMLEAVLRQHYKNPLVSRGNKNSMFAVTENIQNLKRTTAVYMQEVGAASPGVVRISAEQLACDIAVYTNIGLSHIENYGSVEEIAADKLSLSTYGRPDGVAIINMDDPVLMGHKFTQKTITYSLDNDKADYYIENMKKSGEGYDFTIVDNLSRPAKKIPARVNVLGEHNVLHAAAAMAMGRCLGLTDEEITAGIAAYSPSGMRQNLVSMGGYQIYVDCYNASLSSIDTSLDTMNEMSLPGEGGRRIAVLGDVLELGDIAEETHREIGRVIAKHKPDLVLAYGSDMKFAVEEAAAQGIDARHFETKDELQHVLKNTVTKSDITLFKASHGMNMGSCMDTVFGTDINEKSIIGQKKYRLETMGDFEFYIFENSASVRKYLGEGPSCEIPAYIEAVPFGSETGETRNLAVEKTGRTAFRDMPHIKEVILSETLVCIRGGSFKGSGLTSLKAPAGLLHISGEAFAQCPDLEAVELPAGILEVAENAFEGSEKAKITYR